MAHHPSNIPYVEEKLGKVRVKLILDSARNGDISDDQMASIAEKLGRNLGSSNIILGNHKRLVERDRFAKSDTMLRCILSDWWGVELYDMSPEEALSKLVQICRDPDVDLRPLAKKLQSVCTAEPSPAERVQSLGEKDDFFYHPSKNLFNTFQGTQMKPDGLKSAVHSPLPLDNFEVMFKQN